MTVSALDDAEYEPRATAAANASATLTLGRRADWVYAATTWHLLFTMGLSPISAVGFTQTIVTIAATLALACLAVPALGEMTKCQPDEVSNNVPGVVMVKRRLHVTDAPTEQGLRALVMAEYEAIKRSVKNPSKVFIYAFDECSRPPTMWLAMLAQGLDQSPTAVNSSMVSLPPSRVTDVPVIGRWLYAHPNVGQAVTIYRKDGGLWAEEMSTKYGTSRIRKLVEEKVGAEKRLVVPGNASGEYYVIGADGLLRRYDNEGLIDSMTKLDAPAEK